MGERNDGIDEWGGILWEKKNGVLEKIEDQEWPAGRQKIPVTNHLNGEAIGTGGPARIGENPLKLDPIKIS